MNAAPDHAPSAPAAPALEFWFDFASNYSYLSVMRIARDAQRHGVRVIWRPFLLGPIFQSIGWKTSPFLEHKAKGDHAWKDMARQCAKLGIGWRMPSEFPRRSVLAARVALAAEGQAWHDEWCRRVMTLEFAEDRDIGDAGVIAEALCAVGAAPDVWLERASSDEVKLRLRALTAEAAQRGVFGAPTFFVGDELYWGNDRLDDALAFAAGGARLAGG